jgi:formate hydrogenlyase subunit 3/multisubunit Na+/H+ antiporter MnhD subunit
MGYAAMVDTGLAVVALGEASQRGVGVGIWLLFARALGMILMAGGLASVRSWEATGNLIRRAPWSTAAVVVGAMSLAGLPPTVGFAARWSMFLSLLSVDPVRGLLLLVVSVGPAVGFLRFLIESLQRGTDGEKGEAPPARPSPGIVILHLVLLGVLLLGIFPRPLAVLAGRIAGLFTFWGP